MYLRLNSAFSEALSEDWTFKKWVFFEVRGGGARVLVVVLIFFAFCRTCFSLFLILIVFRHDVLIVLLPCKELVSNRLSLSLRCSAKLNDIIIGSWHEVNLNVCHSDIRLTVNTFKLRTIFLQLQVLNNHCRFFEVLVRT